MTISTDKEKAFHKIKHIFMLKICKQLEHIQNAAST